MTKLTATALRNADPDAFTHLLNTIMEAPEVARDMLAILAGAEPKAFAKALNIAREINE